VLQNFYPDVAKVDRGVARRGAGGCAAGAQPWVNPRGFPQAGRGVGAGPYDGCVRGCWGGTRSVG
jgi:hypothetical protein